MTPMRLLSAVSAAALGLSACSSFTASGDPLTEAEANELAGVIVQHGFVGFDPPAGAPAAAPGEAGEAADRVTVEFSDVVPCEGGGNVAFAGQLSADVNQEAQTGTFQFDYTVAPAACEVTSESDLVFTLTGDPNVRAQGEFNWSPSAFDGALGYDGKIRWETADGRSGACGIDLSSEFDVAVTTDASTGSVQVSGKVCGLTINRTVSFES
ncbi:MAG TPA: hypothetical protein VD793_03475 [Gemmatimonadales bacterium]|nr:hypothetical protein [Gemmatimonadales bacterium]